MNKESIRNRDSQFQENEDELTEAELYKKSLLYGLAKIRRAINQRDDALRISNTRRLRERYNIDIYRALAHYGLSHIVSTNVWNMSKTEKRISKIFSIQDEAFILLLFMNNWKVWESMAKGDKRNNDTLFTNTSKTYNGVTLKIKGWNNDGLKEFNETINFLMTVRNTDMVIDIETELMKEYVDMHKSRLGKRKRDNNDDLILADRVLPQDGYSQTFVQR